MRIARNLPLQLKYTTREVVIENHFPSKLIIFTRLLYVIVVYNLFSRLAPTTHLARV